jgi:hypothetical protein
MPRDGWRVVARQTLAIVLLVLAVAGTTSVIVTLVELERIAAAERPEARHWLEREPDESFRWSRFAARLAVHFYVHTQRSLVVAPASAFAIAAAWRFFVAPRRPRRHVTFEG